MILAAALLLSTSSPVQAEAWRPASLHAQVAAGDSHQGGAEKDEAAGEAIPAGAKVSGGVTSDERRLLWRAGSGAVAGLTPARRTERRAERDAAVAELLAALDSGSDREAVLRDELAAVLAEPSSDAEWCAAARVVGATRTYELATLLAVELEEGRSAQRRLAAREALRSLYGRWFVDVADITPFFDAVQPGEGTRMLVDLALEADDRAVDRELERLRLLELDAARFLQSETILTEERYFRVVALLEENDPRLRRGAASLIAALARASEDAEVRIALWEQLAERVSREVDPFVFEGVVELLADELSTRALGEDRLEAVRDDLLELAETVEPERALAVAEGLARLPWLPPKDVQAGGADSPDPVQGKALGAAMSTMGGLLERMLNRDQARGPVEADIVLGMIASASQLLDGIDSPTLPNTPAAGRLRVPLSQIVSLESGRSVGMRIAALSPYVDLARPDDLGILLGQIDEGTPPSFAHALLGALAPRFYDTHAAGAIGDAGAETDEPGAGVPADPAGLEFVSRVAALLGRTKDADLLKRALSLLADERLETLVDRAFAGSSDGAVESTNPGVVETDLYGIERSLLTLLGQPDASAETRSLALRLFERVAAPELLDEFLQLETFNPMASGRPEELSELTSVLQRVADGRADSLYAIARRLVLVPDEKTKVGRSMRAMSFVAGFSDEEAAALDVTQHGEVCGWVLDLHSYGVPIRDSVPEGDAFCDRLLDLHLPRAVGATNLEEWRSAHLRALLLGSRVLAKVEGVSASEVDQVYEQALAVAADENQEIVLRDRARWRMSRGTPKRALEDYERVLDKRVDLLQVSDIRAALSALKAKVTTEEQPLADHNRQRVRWLLALIERDNWTRESTPVRLDDLEAAVNAVTALPNDEADVAAQNARTRLTRFFADFPDPGAEPPAAQTETVWQAFLDKPEHLDRLKPLRAKVMGETSADDETPEAPVESSDEGTDDASSPANDEPDPDGGDGAPSRLPR